MSCVHTGTPLAGNCGCDTGNFEFYAGEDRVLNIHIEDVDPISGQRIAFDLTNYTGVGPPAGKIELKLPNIAELQEATIDGNPINGNITFEFSSELTSVAGSGQIIGILTEVGTGKVRKFKTGTLIKSI